MALRELVFNAILHRDYAVSELVRIYWFADRVEIKSPGALLPDVAHNFPNSTVYRNPILASAMKNLKIIERFRNGIERAQQALHNNGNPPAKFEPDHYSLKVTLYARLKITS